MAALLLRIGGLVIVADILYLTASEAFWGGADDKLFRAILWMGAVCLGGGGLLWLAGRARSSLTARTCARCDRRVTRGRVYCDDHRAEAINRYRDRERERRG